MAQVKLQNDKSTNITGIYHVHNKTPKYKNTDSTLSIPVVL